MTSQPRDKTRDSTKPDTAKFGLDLQLDISLSDGITYFLLPIWTRNMSSQYGPIVMGAIGKNLLRGGLGLGAVSILEFYWSCIFYFYSLIFRAYQIIISD